MTRIINFGTLKIWLYFQQLHEYEGNEPNHIIERKQFICFFKFTEPTVIVLGEPLRDSLSQRPLVFQSVEEAEDCAKSYLAQRFNLVRPA